MLFELVKSAKICCALAIASITGDSNILKQTTASTIIFKCFNGW